MKCPRSQYMMGFWERKAVVADSTHALESVIQKYGPLITPWIAAQMAAVNNKRIYALIDEGRFTKVLVFGIVQIPMREFHAWECSPRTPGRPRSNKSQNEKGFLSELPARSKG